MRNGIFITHTLIFCLSTCFFASGMAMEFPQDLKRKILGNTEELQNSPTDLNRDSPDNSIDSIRYLVGGGDGFRISIVGLPSQEYFPIIDQKGNIFDGDIGIIPLGKVPLCVAESIIAEKVKKKLRKNNEIYISLRKIKKANVTVTGLIANPGTYTISGSMHVFDAVKIANGGTIPSQALVNFRSIEVRNGDSVKSLDLLRFLIKQDVSQNPYVYPGDHIHLRSLDTRIYLTGEFMEPSGGEIPLLPGETVADILKIIRLRKNADTTVITVHIAETNGAQPNSQRTLKETMDCVLGNNDVVSIGSQMMSRRADTITVTGEVNRPGTYFINFHETTLNSVLELAGGPTEQGDVNRAFIIHKRKMNEIINEGVHPGLIGQAGLSQPFPTPVSIRTVRPEISSSISDLLQTGDFSVIEEHELSQKGLLVDGDEVNIPHRETFVYVSGNVRKPGAFPYKAGATYAEYIKEAHGYTRKADSRNSFILTKYKGVTQIRSDTEPKPGDILVVPSSMEYKRFNGLYVPLFQIVPAIVSLVLTFVIVLKTK